VIVFVIQRSWALSEWRLTYKETDEITDTIFHGVNPTVDRLIEVIAKTQAAKLLKYIEKLLGPELLSNGLINDEWQQLMEELRL
jgi:hypothetical protein